MGEREIGVKNRSSRALTSNFRESSVRLSFGNGSAAAKISGTLQGAGSAFVSQKATFAAAQPHQIILPADEDTSHYTCGKFDRVLANWIRSS
jgi:hypothetical protein